MKHILSLAILLALSYFTATAQHGSNNFTYQITDLSGKDIATGQLEKNTSLAVNVPVGQYTLRLTGYEKTMVVKNVVVKEGEEINASSETANLTNVKSVTTGYIVVKVDNNGAFSYNKLVL